RIGKLNANPVAVPGCFGGNRRRRRESTDCQYYPSIWSKTNRKTDAGDRRGSGASVHRASALCYESRPPAGLSACRQVGIPTGRKTRGFLFAPPPREGAVFCSVGRK